MYVCICICVYIYIHYIYIYMYVCNVCMYVCIRSSFIYNIFVADMVGLM